jgi:type VI secretion system protein ImpE
MSADQLLREGNVDEALAALTQQVRAKPADAKLRVFLFQLLAVQGQWERALNQLKVAGEMDAGTLAMVQTYREAIQCELLRAEIFAGKRSPLIFGEPEEWLALLMQALSLTTQGKHEAAGKLREQAFETAPATSGTIVTETRRTGNDPESLETAFEWLADADSRLGPIIEAIVNGRYYWVPLQRVQRIDVEPPADLRDVVWMPAHFVWANGGDNVALIPTRYCGSEQSSDPLVRLARRTDWLEPAPGIFTGAGQRMLAADSGEFPLMDVRQVRLNVAAAPNAGTASANG